MLIKPVARKNKCKVKVIDSLMGTGKTTYAINLIDKAEQMTKFIYVTPYLKEVERIQQEVTTRTFKSPGKQHGMEMPIYFNGYEWRTIF